MESIIAITTNNINREHICCAIPDKKGGTRVSPKKTWMKNYSVGDLAFRKLDARGKVFVEYIPVEKV